MDSSAVDLICEHLLIGVTGSIGAFVVPDYVYKLRKHFARNVHVLMSQSAQQFVTPYVLEIFSANPVFTDSFQTSGGIRVPHIELAQRTSLFLIMPATANILGKAVSGVCDDLISTMIVACQAPIVFVPNMNEAMWSDRIVQRNVKLLREVGYHVVEPTSGVEVSQMISGGCAMPLADALLLSLQVVLATDADSQDAQA
ncbi:MAG: hypothetical protein HC802_08860 [Caldilineaceae bacterium]|nr:hypothetical protein [Caldilineaceae bacterium]